MNQQEQAFINWLNARRPDNALEMWLDAAENIRDGTTTVYITPWDFTNGKQFNGEENPVALAVRRAVGEGWGVNVSFYSMYLWPAGDHHPMHVKEIGLTSPVIKFMLEFDGNTLPLERFKPFKFTLPNHATHRADR